MIATAFVAVVVLLGIAHGSVIVGPDTVAVPGKNITLRKLTKPATLARASSLTDYFISEQPTDYFKAHDECASYDMRPLLVKTAAKHREVQLVLKSNQVYFPVYIGLTYSTGAGKWQWDDGTYLSPVLKKWAPAEGSSNYYRDCAVISGYDYLFYQAYCQTYDPMYFACEKDPAKEGQ